MSATVVTATPVYAACEIHNTAVAARLEAEGWVLQSAFHLSYSDTLQTQEAVFRKAFSAGAIIPVSQESAGWQGLILIW